MKETKERGITLIALIITVIVMLILAGIAINLTIGDNGIFKKSEEVAQIYKNAANNETSSLNNIDTEMENLMNEATASYTVIDGVPVPNGFTHTEGTKETGFVIKNDKDNNEFVWIPTDLVEYGLYDWNKGRGIEQEQRDIEKIEESIKKYKGYYIARYEAGVKIKRTSTIDSKVTPIFQPTSEQQKVYAYNYIDCESAEQLSINLYKKETDNINSYLITAKGWDTALKFIETIGEDKDEEYPIDSTDKGWYSNNKENNSEYETGKSVDLTNQTTPNKLKNIYDMAGNMLEWTSINHNTPSDTFWGRRGMCY